MPGTILLKLIQKTGWDVRYLWSERPWFEARKGAIFFLGETPEKLFEAWSQSPEVMKDVLGIDVRNFEFEAPVEVEHKETVDDEVI